ncbi:DUF1499 domain-containing protein [Yoonia sp.]|uniref:DUF1499 domain-containing protein n=1 Tax=Yoonia sp. TaxID=2212373 RepID=UPI001A01AC4A|nr:DUF1499 domain-containing protein [Yoonia sp.]MBE0412860.1 DUF1499 domain-containing protein [Yoonia sp.]
MILRILTILILLIVAGMAYVRLAPMDPARVHQASAPQPPGDYAATGGFTAVRTIIAPAAQVLATLEQRALATPRTRVVAGRVDQGMITFVTRSRIMGFPDYTTVQVDGDTLTIHGRLRFGQSDLGVNRARVQGWLDALGPLTAEL